MRPWVVECCWRLSAWMMIAARRAFDQKEKIVIHKYVLDKVCRLFCLFFVFFFSFFLQHFKNISQQCVTWLGFAAKPFLFAVEDQALRKIPYFFDVLSGLLCRTCNITDGGLKGFLL